MKAVDGTRGGKLVGDPHSAPTGGIHTLNVDTNETLLVEGREVVINKHAVTQPGVKTYTGTNKEILSQINQSAGNGVPIYQQGGEITALDFDQGKAVIKNGNTVIAKVYDRAVFYPLNGIKTAFTYPYSIEIPGIGVKECSSVEECKLFLNKYNKGEGGIVDNSPAPPITNDIANLPATNADFVAFEPLSPWGNPLLDYIFDIS